MSSTVSPPKSISLQFSRGLSGFRRREVHESFGVPPLIQPKPSSVKQGRARYRPGPGATQRLAVRTHGQQPRVRVCLRMRVCDADKHNIYDCLLV